MDAIIDALHPYPKTPYRKCTESVQPLSFFLQSTHAIMIAAQDVSDRSPAPSHSTKKLRLLRCSILEYIKYSCDFAPCIRYFLANFPALWIYQIPPKKQAKPQRRPFGQPTEGAPFVMPFCLEKGGIHAFAQIFPIRRSQAHAPGRSGVVRPARGRYDHAARQRGIRHDRMDQSVRD